MRSRWDQVRRTPAFTFVAAFVLWVVISRVSQHQPWRNCIVSGVVFAALMTATFEARKRRNRS